jgi:DNA repair and recombination protein RAD52
MFTEQQLAELDKPLNPLLVSNRKGGSGSTLKYIEGHDAIDQANRIFGYGAWTPRVISCKPVVITDPLTNEPVGVTYEAEVELTVSGCDPISEVGQQAVSAWNVFDVVMSRRGKDGDKEAPITAWEKQNAQRVIVDAHEVARKGSVTDGEKRCLRTFWNQFGNSLYGDGRVELVDGDSLDEESLKADWAKVYHIKDTEIDARWPRFKVYALNAVVEHLTADHKVTIHATIQQQLKKSA